jgi:catechol 2,3-dioxygenase-like lactoylglutathione lyase family enzyme
MALEKLEHYTIRCVNMEQSRDFYRDIVRLKQGPRPPLEFPGYWMYCGDVPVVHLVPLRDPSAMRGQVNCPNPADGEPRGTGAVDHIAFRAEDLSGMKRHFTKQGARFEERVIGGGDLTQLFVDDPNGITIELNFWTSKVSRTGAKDQWKKGKSGSAKRTAAKAKNGKTKRRAA